MSNRSLRRRFTARCAALCAGTLLAAAVLPQSSAQQATQQPPAPAASASDTIDVLRVAEQIAGKMDRAASPPGPGGTSGTAGTMAGLQQAPSPVPARLYVFVSFSMPQASLHRLAAQAASLQVPLVLRGMVGESLSATATRAAAVVQAVPGASFEIDPMAFRRFGITQVPSFVIAAPAPACTTVCLPGDAGQIVIGDVTLSYALAQLGRGSGTNAALARTWHGRLEGKR